MFDWLIQIRLATCNQYCISFCLGKQVMLLDFLRYYFYNALCLACALAVGHAVLHRFSAGSYPHFRRFTAFLTGLSLFALCTGVFLTGGRTVLWAMLIPVCGIFLQVKFGSRPLSGIATGTQPAPGKTARGWLAQAAILLFFLLLVYAINFCLIYQGGQYFGGNAAHSDNVFYADLSKFLSAYGVEGYRAEFYYPHQEALQPYHYYELWINAGLAFLFGTTHLSTWMLLTSTLGFYGVWLGFNALIEQLKKITFADRCLLLLCLFVTGTAMFYPVDFFTTSGKGILAANVFVSPKLFTIHLFVLLATVLFLMRQPQAALYSLLILPVVGASTFPVVFLSLAIIWAVRVWFRIEGVNYAHLFRYAALTGLFLVLFYALQSGRESNYLASSYLDVFTVEYFILTGKIFLVTVLQTACFFLPLSIAVTAVAIAKVKAKTFGKLLAENPLVPIAGLVLACALIVRALCEYMVEAWQLFSNLCNPLLNVAAVTVFYYLWTTAKGGLRLVCLGSLLLLAGAGIQRVLVAKKIRPYSDAYIARSKALLSDTNGLGGIIANQEHYLDVVGHYESTMPSFGTHLSLIDSRFNLVLLGYPDFASGQRSVYSNVLKSFVTRGAFYRFARMRQGREPTHRTLELDQAAFANAFQLDYLIVAPGARIPGTLQHRVWKTTVDRNTKEMLCIFRKTHAPQMPLVQREAMNRPAITKPKPSTR